MDSKELRELIEIISRSNFTTFELEREGLRLKLVKGTGAPRNATAAPVEVAAALAQAAPQALAAPAEAAAQPAAPVAAGLVEVTSPIVGTFYRSSGPDAPPFVEPGSRVKKGQVLCIVEAMKLMNEIESEIEAEVVEILIPNGQPVEFGQAMFRLRPLSS